MVNMCVCEFSPTAHSPLGLIVVSELCMQSSGQEVMVAGDRVLPKSNKMDRLVYERVHRGVRVVFPLFSACDRPSLTACACSPLMLRSDSLCSGCPENGTGGFGTRFCVCISPANPFYWFENEISHSSTLLIWACLMYWKAS